MRPAGELPVSHVSRILPLLFQNGGPFRHLPYLAPHLQRPEQPYGAALSPLSSRGRLRLRFPRGLGRGYGWRRVGRRRNPGTLRLVPVRQKRTDGTPLEEYFVVIIRSKRAGIRQSDENTYCKQAREDTKPPPEDHLPFPQGVLPAFKIGFKI